MHPNPAMVDDRFADVGACHTMLHFDGFTRRAGRQHFSWEPGHRNNIFQAKVIPSTNDRTIVSCAADGQVRGWKAQVYAAMHLAFQPSITPRVVVEPNGAL